MHAVGVLAKQVVFASHVGRPKHKRAMIGGALDGDVFLGKKVRYRSINSHRIAGKSRLFLHRTIDR